MKIIEISKFLKFIFLFLLLINLYIYIPKSIQFQLHCSKDVNHYILYNKIMPINIEEIELFFNYTPLKYYFSYLYNIIEVEFNVKFYDKNRNLIKPSSLFFYNEFHILCYTKKNNIIIVSLSTIYKNKYFKCLEYFRINEVFSIGFKIYKNREKIKTFSLFTNKNINYKNYLFKNVNKLNPLIINKYYYFDSSHIIKNKNNVDNYSVSLKKLYISNPNYSPKNKIISQKNIWHFKNIYNHYFCFCIGKNCLKRDIDQECKYKFYLNIIDNNRFLYSKTDYLFADFLFENIATGEAYLVFKEMLKQNLPAHYVTSRNDVYNEYINDNNNLKIIYIKNKNYNITADTIEKYLNLFLRLKAVVSGAEFYSIYNIFYNIEYITFICLGHGVNYFKPFLYKDYYGNIRYNKIVLPSNIIIKVAKKYGWTDYNIIKIGLPRWDLFDNSSMEIKKFSKDQILNKSIFMMFTWRALNKGKDISPFYFKNIFKLIKNNELNKALEKYNLTLFISVHHNLLYNKNLINSNKNIKYVNQENIIDCLINSSLIISDFSSVIFDFIYQNKPFIIFIPDSEDKNISDLYIQEYFNIINGLKNGSIYFENKYFSTKRAINKILYYIKNNFKIEKKLKIFYDNFEFKGKFHTNKLIHYLKNLF